MGFNRAAGHKPVSSIDSAFARAALLLGRREYGEQELAKALREKGFEQPHIDIALARLKEFGLQSDERASLAVFRRCAQSGKGPGYAKQQLRQRFLTEPTTDDSSPIDWDELADKALRRKFGSGQLSRAQQQKAYAFLMQRGFSGDCIRKVIQAFGQEDESLF